MTWNSNSSKLISSLVRLNIFSAHTKWQSWERRCLAEQWKSPPGKDVPGKHESIHPVELLPSFHLDMPWISIIIRNPQIHWSIPIPLNIGQRTAFFPCLKGLNVRHCWCRSWYWHLALLHHLKDPCLADAEFGFLVLGCLLSKRIPTSHGILLLMRLMHHEMSFVVKRL